MRHPLICLFFLGINLFCSAQNPHKYLRKGDNAYKENNFEESQQYYYQARDKKNAPQVDYNLGNAQFQQKNYDKALEMYDYASKNGDRDIKNRAFYNGGNALVEQKKNAEALIQYREALRNNPNDVDAQYNYSFLKKQLDKQNQQKPKNKNNKQKGDNKDENNPPPKQEPQNNGNNPPPKQENDPSRDMKQDEALRALKMLENEERKVQRKQKLGKNGLGKNEKDW